MINSVGTIGNIIMHNDRYYNYIIIIMATVLYVETQHGNHRHDLDRTMAARQTMLQYRATFEGVQLVWNAYAGLNKLPQAALVLINSKLLQPVLFKVYG